jgi:hypothetical protein
MPGQERARRSLAGRVAVVLCATAIVAAVLSSWLDQRLDAPWLAGAVALLVTLPPAIWFTHWLIEGWSRSIRAVTDGISSLRDRDFSVSVTASVPATDQARASHGVADGIRARCQSTVRLT